MKVEASMRTARTWIEEVTFVECPYCGESMELGTEVVVNDGEVLDCDKCDKKFSIKRGDR